MLSRMLVAALAAAALSVSTAAGVAQASPAVAQPGVGATLGSVVTAVVNFFTGGQQAKPANQETGTDVDQDSDSDTDTDVDHDGPSKGK